MAEKEKKMNLKESKLYETVTKMVEFNLNISIYIISKVKFK